MSEQPIRRLCLIVPCYNEEDVLPEFFRRVSKLAGTMPDVQLETLYIDDGSTDATPALLASHAAEDPNMRVLIFSRNFGHQVAITAGIDHCDADGAIILDADLQDPPERAIEVLRELRNGADVVHMIRTRRLGDSTAKRWSAWVFYAFMHRWGSRALPENAADFKGLSRRAVEALRRYPERIRFLRGLIAELGYNQVSIPYVRDPRHAGRSKYPWGRILRLATDAALSHSAVPMRVVMVLGIASVAAAFFAPLALGWTMEALIVFLMVFYAGLGLAALGLIGEYLTRILAEVKQRPLYILKSALNLEPTPIACDELQPIEHELRARSHGLP